MTSHTFLSVWLWRVTCNHSTWSPLLILGVIAQFGLVGCTHGPGDGLLYLSDHKHPHDRITSLSFPSSPNATSSTYSLQYALGWMSQQQANYNTAGSLSARELPNKKHPLALFRRKSSADDIIDSGTNSPAILSPYDYKTIAMEMAYLTPRRKVSSVRLLSSGAGSPRHRPHALMSGSSSTSPASDAPPLESQPYQQLQQPPQQPQQFFRAESLGEQDNLLMRSPDQVKGPSRANRWLEFAQKKAVQFKTSFIHISFFFYIFTSRY